MTVILAIYSIAAGVVFLLALFALGSALSEGEREMAGVCLLAAAGATLWPIVILTIVWMVRSNDDNDSQWAVFAFPFTEERRLLREKARLKREVRLNQLRKEIAEKKREAADSAKDLEWTTAPDTIPLNNAPQRRRLP